MRQRFTERARFRDWILFSIFGVSKRFWDILWDIRSLRGSVTFDALCRA